MKILCVGQSAWDITLPMCGYPIENRKVKINNKKIECGGGSSNNASYLLGKWGCDVYLASTIGNDIYGDNIIKELNSVNVNTIFFERIDNLPTTTSYIIANIKNGSRTIITNRDFDMKFSSNYVIDLKPDVILLDGNDYEMSLRVLKENKNALSIIDAGSIKDGMVELCQSVNIVACSNDFARDYTGIDFDYSDIDTLIKVYEKLENDFHNQIIITLESNGSFTKIDDKYIIIPSIKVECVDSTGAGDIFHGALTYFISKGYDLYASIRYANIAGALSCTKIGGKYSIPDLAEVTSYELR